MTRARFGFVFILIAFPILLLAQDQPTTTANADNALTAPVQLRRMAPPEATMGPEELEARGEVLRAQKAFADALDYFQAAVRKKATPGLHNKIGIVQMQMLRYEEAKKSFERAIKMDRTFADAHNNLGVIYYVKRDYGKAIKEYKLAIQYRVEVASYYSNMGTALFEKKDYEKASTLYAQALQLDPDIFERRSTMGIAVHMASPEDRAKYHFVIARMFANQGETDRSLLYLRKAIEEGYPEINQVYKEPEFATLRKDPRFTALMEELKVLQLPN